MPRITISAQGGITDPMNTKPEQKIDFKGFDFLELISKAFKQTPRSEEYREALKELTAKGVRQKAWLN